MDPEEFMLHFFKNGGGAVSTYKKVFAHGKHWIAFNEVKRGLFLAIESGTTPPCDVKLIRVES